MYLFIGGVGALLAGMYINTQKSIWKGSTMIESLRNISSGLTRFVFIDALGETRRRAFRFFWQCLLYSNTLFA